MKKVTLILLTMTLLTVMNVNGSVPITWAEKEFTCPIDNQKNTFMVIASYGSYIYNYPSKYQWLFFPYTSGNNFYMCKKCHLTTYMWDFDKLPVNKIPALRKALEELKFFEKVYEVYRRTGYRTPRSYAEGLPGTRHNGRLVGTVLSNKGLPLRRVGICR